MNQNNYYSIKSTIELKFNNSQIRDISYNSFLPEFNKVKTKRSKIKMAKENNSLIFYIESTDITAFRASISDIIGFGKIIDNTLKLCE
jgi:tRNA threonylcarbamoyladenosine modification (KEOPS) complex  Pcc1 subunit